MSFNSRNDVEKNRFKVSPNVYFSSKKNQNLGNSLRNPEMTYNLSTYSTKNTDFSNNKNDFKNKINSFVQDDNEKAPISIVLNNNITQVPNINSNFNINIYCDRLKQVKIRSIENSEKLDSIYETVTDNELDSKENEISNISNASSNHLEIFKEKEFMATRRQSNMYSDLLGKTFSFPWINTKITEVKFDLKKIIDLEYLRNSMKYIPVKV